MYIEACNTCVAPGALEAFNEHVDRLNVFAAGGAGLVMRLAEQAVEEQLAYPADAPGAAEYGETHEALLSDAARVARIQGQIVELTESIPQESTMIDCAAHCLPVGMCPRAAYAIKRLVEVYDLLSELPPDHQQD